LSKPEERPCDTLRHLRADWEVAAEQGTKPLFLKDF
jgi:hypothetical protein